MPKKRIDWVAMGMHLFWVLFWASFIFIWGFWKWRTAEFGGPEWIFDNYGHALATFAGAVNLIYEIQYFWPTALSSARPIKRASILWAVVPSVILVLAVVWEGFEAYHDLRSLLIKAQKGDLDTTVDILLAIPFSYLGVLIRTGWDSLVSYRNPKIALDTMLEEYFLRRKALKEEKRELRLLGRKIRALRHEQAKELPQLVLKRVIPIGLTIMRLLLVPIIIYYLPSNPYFAFLLSIIAAFTDWLDGMLARRWDAKTKLGIVLDPMVDKIFYLGLLLYFWLNNFAPVFIVLAVTLPSEIGLVIVRCFKSSREANYFGKMKAVLHYSAISTIILGLATMNNYILTAGIVMGFLAVPLSWKSLYSHLRGE